MIKLVQNEIQIIKQELKTLIPKQHFFKAQ